MASLPPENAPNQALPLPSLPKGTLSKVTLPVEKPTNCQVILHHSLLQALVRRALLDEGAIVTGYLGGHMFHDGQTHFYSLDALLQEQPDSESPLSKLPTQTLAYFTTDPLPHGPSPPTALLGNILEGYPWIIHLSLRIPTPASHLTCSMSFTRPGQSTPIPHVLASVPSTRASYASALRALLHRARHLSSSKTTLPYKRFLQGLLAREIPETLREVQRFRHDSALETHTRHAQLACRLTLLTAAIAAPDTPFPVRATFSRGSSGKKTDVQGEGEEDGMKEEKDKMIPEHALPHLLQGLLKQSLASRPASAPRSSLVEGGPRSRWASSGEEEAEWILRHPTSCALRPSPHPPSAQVSGVPLWVGGSGGSQGLSGSTGASVSLGRGTGSGSRRRGGAQSSSGSTSGSGPSPGNTSYPPSLGTGTPTLSAGRGRGKKAGGVGGNLTIPTPSTAPLEGQTMHEGVYGPGGSRKRGRTVGSEAQPDMTLFGHGPSGRTVVYASRDAPSSRTIPYASTAVSGPASTPSSPSMPHITSHSVPSHAMGGQMVHGRAGQAHPMGGQVHPMTGQIHPHHAMYGQTSYPPQGLMQPGTPGSHPAYAIYHPSTSSSSATPTSTATSTSSPTSTTTTSSHSTFPPPRPPPPASAMGPHHPGMMPPTMIYGGQESYHPGTEHPMDAHASPVPDPSSPGPSGTAGPGAPPMAHSTYSTYPSTHPPPYLYHAHSGFTPGTAPSSAPTTSSQSVPTSSTSSPSLSSTVTPTPISSSSLPGLGPRGGEEKPLPGLGPRGGEDQSSSPLPGLGHSARPPPHH
ncbi:hypothetical protein BJ684DRAFT_20362 [Piptocephalis cylindrospora]|uniref:Uncharacterized protein n=1 Tax=Piptocephalis cylindrospora TaxID=1907219 RepID=A0A4P9Y2L3_9FUNG|nr:hypothetical protein BJ684DRAFT_20362 [Piptocephalis cylindrospora]|eukprot:RKP13128.1 hypothetical protein BJ684DRAFT_20362 [Piptocephalis cylindrospora]